MKKVLIAIFSLVSSAVIAQTTITGTVVDEENNPVPAANIVVIGITEGAVADFEWKFHLNYIGYPAFSNTSE